MPGIAGLITAASQEWAEAQLRCMLKPLRHERFYVCGAYCDANLGVYVGWTARAGSFSEGMPVRNESGDVVLVFSGEEYPSPETRIRLRERGHTCAPDGPAYLAHLYEDDRTFFCHLNGRFHGILMDKARGAAILFNDRFGMQKIYWHQAKEAFYFSAEAKAILEVRPELRRTDMRSLGEFISCGCVLEDRTLFEGIQVLPPGSAWEFRRGELRTKDRYFQASEWEDRGQFEPEVYHENIREVFARVLPRYLNGPEGLGMSLTGGLDTRAVMAWQRLKPGALPCYTYGEAGRDCRDVVVARQVARECRQPHKVIRLETDFFSRFSHYAERSIRLTDACTDITRAPDLYLSERAREIAPVRMTGLYGDEVLRPQIRAFKPGEFAPGILSPDLTPTLRAARDTYFTSIQCHPTSFAVFRQAPWHHFGILALEQTQLTVRTPFLDNDFVATAFRAPRAATSTNDFRVRLIADGNKKLQRLRTDRGFAGNSDPIASWLVRNYQMFTFRAEYAYDYGMPQWLAIVDHLFAPLQLERLFLGRHKVYHYRVWYRDVLADYVREMLLDSRTLTRPWLIRTSVERLVRAHLDGTRNYTTEISRLLTLELLHRLFLDSN